MHMPRRSSPSARVFFPRFDRETLVEVLRERLPALAARLPLVRVVLFGSWACGTHTVASDVDLLIVYEGERREDAFALAKSVLALPGIEPHTYTVDEAGLIQGRFARMNTGGIVLFPYGAATEGSR